MQCVAVAALLHALYRTRHLTSTSQTWKQPQQNLACPHSSEYCQIRVEAPPARSEEGSSDHSEDGRFCKVSSLDDL